jgi:hypothetical protein
LTIDKERLLVTSVQTLADVGAGRTKDEIKRIVTEYLKESNQTHKLKNGNPGKKWFQLFMKRWSKELSSRTAQNLPKCRAIAITQDCVDEFYSKVEKKFKELEDAFGPIGPENIFNCDEFGLSSCQGDTKIICRRGTKNPCVQVADVDKAYYTINYCCNSLGEFLPPYIIFKSLHL